MLAATMLFSGCSSSTGNLNAKDTVSAQIMDGSVDETVELWSAPATEKVLKDKTSGYYEDIKSAPEIRVYSAKGEYEGAQLILTSTTKEVTGIDLIPSALTLDGSNVTFPVENIEVFFEKYLEVNRIYDVKSTNPTGKYPDALPPLEGVIDRGENKMDKNSNQGLYVRFNVPTNQQAGIYTGEWTLQFNGGETIIPVELEVMDMEVSQETHSRSMFLHDWMFGLGELDTTQSMFMKYVKAGFEYRISPGYVAIDNTYDDEGLQYYIDQAVSVMQNPKCTHVSLLLETAIFPAEPGPNGEEMRFEMPDGELVAGLGFNEEKLAKLLKGFIDKSIEDNYDYIRKLGCHLVDEPYYNESNGGFENTKIHTTQYKRTLTKVADELAAETRGQTAFGQQLVESVRGIKGIVSGSRLEKYDPYVDTYCPLFRECDTAPDRAKYDDQEEKWWYGCVDPAVPYPTYHIEDSLLSARLVSWMQAEYNFVGNLYWASTIYARYNGTNYVHIEDIYEGDACRFDDKVNGDGWLFYPGKHYGVDGPIGSMRLEAIRDGLEEYELFYSIKEKYKEISNNIGISIDPTKVISNLSVELYSGTQVNTDVFKFNDAREALYSLAMMVNSNCKLTIVDFSDNGSGLVTYKVFAATGFEVTNGENPPASVQAVNGGNLFTLTCDLNNGQTKLELIATNGTETYTYTKNLGGKATIYGAEDFAGYFESDTADVLGETFDTSLGGTWLAVDVDASLENTQRIKFTAPILGTINSDHKKLVIHLYLAGVADGGETFTVGIKQKNYRFLQAPYTGTVENGYVDIEVNLSKISWSYKEITYMTLSFDTPLSEAKTLYIKDIVIYEK